MNGRTPTAASLFFHEDKPYEPLVDDVDPLISSFPLDEWDRGLHPDAGTFGSDSSSLSFFEPRYDYESTYPSYVDYYPAEENTTTSPATTVDPDLLVLKRKRSSADEPWEPVWAQINTKRLREDPAPSGDPENEVDLLADAGDYDGAVGVIELDWFLPALDDTASPPLSESGSPIRPDPGPDPSGDREAEWDWDRLDFSWAEDEDGDELARSFGVLNIYEEGDAAVQPVPRVRSEPVVLEDDDDDGEANVLDMSDQAVLGDNEAHCPCAACSGGTNSDLSPESQQEMHALFSTGLFS
ncbi:unnamed protein product [Mycena citricolor]|uniref:Uncharacterized protein n=1 Tax=Mycena citricolor TaxID=2018698 RepID=A0AAD2GXP4_9AGAR|nr:unnamed protein product [Mycena citricolor]